MCMIVSQQRINGRKKSSLSNTSLVQTHPRPAFWQLLLLSNTRADDAPHTKRNEKIFCVRQISDGFSISHGFVLCSQHLFYSKSPLHASKAEISPTTIVWKSWFNAFFIGTRDSLALSHLFIHLLYFLFAQLDVRESGSKKIYSDAKNYYANEWRESCSESTLNLISIHEIIDGGVPHRKQFAFLWRHASAEENARAMCVSVWRQRSATCGGFTCCIAGEKLFFRAPVMSGKSRRLEC